MSASAIVVSNVSKSFRIPHVEHASLRGKILHPFAQTRIEEFDALEDVTFDVKEGEFFGIVGRNGSGKSTLLKVIAGIYKPDSGEVVVNGSLAPFIELGVGFNPELSGRDNTFINGALLGLSEQRIRDRYDAIVDFAELHRFMDLKLRNFSSGMQVRLAFAIALEAGADILLTDEVLAVGDENFQRKCFDIFRRRKAEGRTILFVTHDMSAVLDFCDRSMLLKDGRVVALGDTREVVRQYQKLNILQEDDVEASKIDDADSPAEIVSIAVTSAGDSDPDDTFDQGTRLELTVVTKFHETMQDPIIGLLVTDTLGKQIINTNNWWVRDDVGECPAGSELTMTFALDNVLSHGEYLVHAEVAGAGPGPVVHGLREGARFRVTAPVESYGVFDPPLEIDYSIR